MWSAIQTSASLMRCERTLTVDKYVQLNIFRCETRSHCSLRVLKGIYFRSRMSEHIDLWTIHSDVSHVKYTYQSLAKLERYFAARWMISSWGWVQFDQFQSRAKYTARTIRELLHAIRGISMCIIISCMPFVNPMWRLGFRQTENSLNFNNHGTHAYLSLHVWTRRSTWTLL